MEAWAHPLCRAATPRRRPGLGGSNCRQPTWPMAAHKEPRAPLCHAKGLLHFTRPAIHRTPAHHIIRRTAGYGPVCPVVWEGRSREAPPYPDYEGLTVVTNAHEAPYDILDFRPSIRKSRTMAAEDDSGTPRRVTRPYVQTTLGERSGTP